MAILQGARITGSVTVTQFIKAASFSGSLTASNLYVRGNVGIGTSSPTAKLDVSGGSYNTGIIIRSNNTLGSGVGLINSDTGGKTWYIISTASSNTGGAGNLGFFNATDNFYRLYIKSDGNVGLGTTSPTQRLQLGDFVSTSTATPETINFGATYSNTAGTNLKLRIYDDNNGVAGGMGVSNGQIEVNTWSTGKIAFYRGTTQSAIIDTSGNLGVGTSSPGAPLTIYRASNPWIRVNGGGAFSYIQLDDGTSYGYLLKNSSSDTSNGALAGALYTYTDSNKAFQHIHSGTPLFTILSNGNVGIGTTSPLAKLQVTGGRSYFFSADNYSIGLAQTAAQANYMYLGTASDGTFYISETGGTARVTVKQDGNVGIGTSPGALLDLYKGVNGDVGPEIRLGNNGNASANAAAITYDDTGANAGRYLRAQIKFVTEGSPYYGQIQFLTGLTTLTQKVIIKGDGNLGIGTSSPGAKLDVNGDVYISPNTAGKNTFILSTNASNDARLLMKSDTTTKVDIQANGASYFNGGNVIIGNTTAYAGLTISDITANDANDSLAFFYRGTSGAHESLIRFYDFRGQLNASFGNNLQDDGLGTQKADLVFKTAFNANPTERMRITNTGNVGIGTTSVSANLVVGYNGTVHYEEAGGTNVLIKGRTGNSRGLLEIHDSAGTVKSFFQSVFSTGLAYIGTISTHSLVITTTGTERVRIDTNGNVGIGTSSPTAKLQVGTQMYASAPDANYFVVGNENFSGPGPVGGITGYPATANKNQVTASLFDVVGGWERVNGSHALLRVSAYDVINSTPALTVLNNGNIGIGTSSPGARLDVRPATSTAYQGTVPYQTTTTAILSPVMAAASVDTYTSILQLVSVRQALVAGRYAHGYLGFSTVDNSNVSGLLDAGRISIKNDDGIGLYSGTSMGFWTNTGGSASNSATERVRIASDGNVGIGTTSPIAPLDVQCNTGGTGIVIRGRADNTTALRFYANNGTTQQLYIGTDDSNIDFNSVSTRPIRFFVNDLLQYQISQLGVFSWKDGAGGTRMTLNSTGLGIGTTSPVDLLTVQGDINSNYNSNGTSRVWRTFATNHASGNRGAVVLFGMYDGSPAGMNVVNAASSNPSYNSQYITFLTHEGAVSADERMRITSLGSVGIGTTSPANLLHVAGTIRTSYFSTFYGMGETGLGLLATYGSFNQSITFASSNTNNRFRFYFDAYTSDLYVQNSTDAGSTINTRLFIKSDGNVGIGTTTTGEKITISGNALVFGGTGAVGTGTAYYLGDGANSRDIALTRVGTAALAIGRYYPSAWAETIRFTADGNVGIGTSSPASLLHVQSSATTTLLRIDNSNSSNDAAVLLTDSNNPSGEGLKVTYDSSVGDTYFNNIYTASTRAFNFQKGDFGSGTDLLTILNNGNVGIGTSSPSSKLEVVGDFTTLKDGADTIQRQIYIANAVNNRAFNFQLNSGGTGLDLWSYNSSNAWLKHTTFDYDGKIGIGTTSPAAKLDVTSATDTFSLINATNTAQGNRAALFMAARNVNGNVGNVSIEAISVNNQQNDMVFRTGATTMGGFGNERMRIDTTGNVGIGTSSPVNKLHVSGSSTNLPLKLEGLTSNATGYFLTVDNTTGVVYKSTSGASGTSGTSGANGSPGTSGSSGASGAAGTSGSSGANGGTGSSGSSGTTSIKAWVHFDGTATSGTSGIAPNASNNVSSITDNGTGDYTINFTSAFANAFYVVSGTVTYDYENPGQSINNTFIAVPRRPTAQAAGSCRIVTFALDNVLYDCKYVRVAFSN